MIDIYTEEVTAVGELVGFDNLFVANYSHTAPMKYKIS